ncbi:cytochrome P450 [Amylostereum chailletii]|nr:cytochrome P450 [Amylostereum chailletii]
MALADTSPLPLPSALLGLFGAIVVLRLWYTSRNGLNAIPTVGYSGPLLSYITAYHFIFRGDELIKEGYRKFKPGVFKVAQFEGWRVIVSGRNLVEDMRKAPDDVLSFKEATRRMVQMEYTFGPEIHHNPYHIPIVRMELTRNIANASSAVQDEVEATFNDVIPTEGDEWVKVRAIPAVLKVVCRASNRVFVGSPLCRDEDFQNLNIEYAKDVIVAGKLISMFPEFLHSLAAPLLTPLPKQTRRQMRHLAPIITERQRKLAEYGTEWEDKPDDMLMWLMEAATGEERSLTNLSRRILAINFAAIHTTSLSFTHALYHLAAGPEYVKPLREEIESIVAEERWSKAGFGKMHKLDSFMRESQRFNSLATANLTRFTLKPFTFSNGITVPAGTMVSCAEVDIQHDDENYENADTFKPFRFSDVRQEEGQTAKLQMISTSPEFLVFGHGRHACPGRFFAANLMKCMFAHVVLNYDVRFEDGVEGIPQIRKFDMARIPADVNVLFRKRQA